MKLLNFVTTTARTRKSAERKAAVEQRRECYKAANWEEYKEIVSNMF